MHSIIQHTRANSEIIWSLYVVDSVRLSKTKYTK